MCASAYTHRPSSSLPYIYVCVICAVCTVQAEVPAQLVPKGPPLVQFSLQEMDTARELLAAEVEVVRGAMGHGSLVQQEYLETWMVVVNDVVFDDKVGRW